MFVGDTEEELSCVRTMLEETKCSLHGLETQYWAQTASLDALNLELKSTQEQLALIRKSDAEKRVSGECIAVGKAFFVLVLKFLLDSIVYAYNLMRKCSSSSQ